MPSIISGVLRDATVALFPCAGARDPKRQQDQLQVDQVIDFCKSCEIHTENITSCNLTEKQVRNAVDQVLTAIQKLRVEAENADDIGRSLKGLSRALREKEHCESKKRLYLSLTKIASKSSQQEILMGISRRVLFA